MYPNLPLFYLEKVKMMLFSRHLTMFMCNIYLTVVHLKKKKKSVTTRCAFFSFYRYREGYKSRAVMEDAC